jgi:hypothetical protein
MAAFLAMCAPASAATTVGGVFNPDSSCVGFTAFQTGAPGNQYTVPTAGVLTSWSFAANANAPASLRLKVGREVGPNAFLIVGHSALEGVFPSGLRTFATRIPVQAGDVIGFHQPTSGEACDALPDYSVQFVPGDPEPGATVATSPSPTRLDIAAILEPDADCDDFGDETQDPSVDPIGCDKAAPTASITKAPKDKVKTKKKRAKATFEFSGTDARAIASFQCSLDGAAFTPCTSPHTVNVKKGTHSFAVRAVDQAGNLGTPVSDDWKVKRKEKKK